MVENQPPQNSFYDHFASFLRVKSNINDLHQAKEQIAAIKLPSLSKTLDHTT